MATNYEDYERRMHETVDDRLGDVIEILVPPAIAFVPVKGFVLKDDANFSPSTPIDPLNQISRVKLRKTILPVPTRDVRLRAAKLGAGTFQIAGDPDDGASHWLFDVQLADD